MEPSAPGRDPLAPTGELVSALATLTDDQRSAVEAPAPPLCVLAGAGSGKTRVLTLRVARRILDGTALADHTTVCTFTRKAAGELRDRLHRYGVAVSTPGRAGTAPGAGVRSGTLHQLALTLLRRRALDAGRPPPEVVEHRHRLLSGLGLDPATAAAVGSEIGWAKARCLSPAAYAEAAEEAGRRPGAGADDVGGHFLRYEEALARRRVLDLDDVLLRAADLLEVDADFAAAARWRYQHLFVDEFQDVNSAQFRLVLGLLGPSDDLCAVGDPNQAIYGWNGADPGLLGSLPDVLPAIQVVRLGANHRSTPQVVAAAAAALGQAAVVPPRSVADDGPLPVVTRYPDGDAEVAGVAARLLDADGPGAGWGDQAVLARTHDQLAAVGRALAKAGIPYRMAPGPESAEAPVHAPPGGGTGRKGSGTGPAARFGRTAGGTQAGAGGETDAVELATFHRAKGLEWDTVHVVGLEEGFVPIVFAESGEALAEERRLLYVALTRASRRLYCSWAESRRMGSGRQMDRRWSPWLAPVARVARTGDDRVDRRQASDTIARIRAGLGR